MGRRAYHRGVTSRLPVALLLSLGLACGPGLEEGRPRDASPPPERSGDRAALDRSRDRAPTDAWACVEHFATNYDHVAQGRATICGGHACAQGSGDDLGLYNTAVGTTLRETRKGYFELGPCP